jgi:medium-chain acyl-[acyl-carrier-protein] hydrolase
MRDYNDGVEVFPVQLPGREDRLAEPPFRDLFGLVSELAPRLAHNIQGPFALLGGSMGALLAFEAARRLRRDYGLVPVHLFVAACRPPSVPRTESPLHGLPDDELIHAIKSLGGTPDAVLRDSELFKLLLPTIRADLALCETYRYRTDAPLPCPISAYAGVRDYELARCDLSGWQRETTRQFVMRTFDGGHFFLRTSAAEVYSAIADVLAANVEVI